MSCFSRDVTVALILKSASAKLGLLLWIACGGLALSPALPSALFAGLCAAVAEEARSLNVTATV